MSEQSPLDENEFASAINVLHQILPNGQLDRMFPSGPATIYTTLVTIWMMLLQRLGRGETLNFVVKEVQSHNRDLLPQLKRVREGTLSKNSAAFSRARTRLTQESLEFFADRVCRSLMSVAPPLFAGRQGFILDGTTITLAPTPELKAAFPPATNQHGESVWPVALLMVAHELHSGCALAPEIGAMYGDDNTSEAQLSRQIAPRIPVGSIVLADSNFGIFSVGFEMVQYGHHILFRLTKSRFKALRRQATVLEKAKSHMTYKLHWTPSAKDRQTNPQLPADAAIDVLIHEVTLPTFTLYLVTTLHVPAPQAGEFYARRYDVEHNIRDVKVTLDTENIRGKTVKMVHKELLTSLIAYNLVVQFRRQAAKLADVAPRRLSFTGVWNTFDLFLLKQPPCSAPDWQARFAKALTIAAADKLPNRPGRNYPRKAHPRRPKSTKFMKQTTQPPEAAKVSSKSKTKAKSPPDG